MQRYFYKGLKNWLQQDIFNTVKIQQYKTQEIETIHRKNFTTIDIQLKINYILATVPDLYMKTIK